jgi:hypothetical protein
MQRNFELMRKQVEAWQRSELTDVTAKVVSYEAFVEGKPEAPRHLARSVVACTISCRKKNIENQLDRGYTLAATPGSGVDEFPRHLRRPACSE